MGFTLMQRFLSLIKNKKGMINIPELLITLIVVMMLIFMALDVAGYLSLKMKIRTALRETLTLMKAENGFDYNTGLYFENCAAKLDLDTSNITLTGTPKLVQRGDAIEIEADTTYEVKALRPFGTRITWTVHETATGLAHTPIR